MAISDTAVRDDLVALSGILAASGNVHDDLKGMSALAGNEAEAAIADVAQTLSFTTWIGDICDGLQQEKELDRGSDEYNENAENIRNTIGEINNLGKSLGFDHDIIPTPSNGQEAIVAAQYVYNQVALPYQMQKRTGEHDVDYAKYITCQAQDNPIAEAMGRLNAQVAQSKQYGTHAVNFRKAQVKAANNFTALNYMFLEGIDSINECYNELGEMKGFLKKEDDNAVQGISTTNMGTFGVADKIDFEGDDIQLRNKMRNAIRKAEKYLKKERQMLSAGHIGTERQAIFAELMQDCMKEIKHYKKEIEKDNLLDAKATAELETQMVEHPDEVSKEHEEKYIEMVKKQQFGKPTFTGSDLISSASLIRLGIEGMNVALIAANVAPIGITAMSSIEMLQLGKFAFHSASFLTRESSKESRDFSLMPTYNGGKVAAAKAARAASRSKEFSQDVYRTGSIFAMNMREIVAGLVQPTDENAPDYYANQHCVTNIENLFEQIMTQDETQTELSKDVSDKQRELLTKLQTASIMATGHKAFSKDPAMMSDKEIAVAVASVKVVMSPMKSNNKSLLENYADSFGVYAPEMTATQTANMDAMIAFGAAGHNDAALAIREKQTEIADLSYQYKMHKSRRTATEDLEADDIEELIKTKQGEMNNVLRAYGPQCQQMQMLGMSYMCQSGQVTYMTDFSPNDSLNGTAASIQQSQPNYDFQYVPKSMSRYM